MVGTGSNGSDGELRINLRRLTTAQAIVRFLAQQYVERDGVEQRFFAGCWGIFGHGNVAGIGQALQECPELPYYLPRNEQAMVHTAAAFAKLNNRLRTFACTSSIGPGATNMLTAAAGATINRLPVLLLPGDTFARRNVDPVLQQLEFPMGPDVSVNDAFRPISRYWDRIQRPEQAIPSLLEAMRVLTSPAETGTVTLALPQDVQPEAYDFPAALFQKRVWHVARPVPEPAMLQRAVAAIKASKRPLIVAGGGAIYSEATEALRRFVEQTGIPVGETQAGKGVLPWDHAQCLGSIGATGTLAANRIARGADLIIGLGTRYSDFTTASNTLFENAGAAFVNINVAAFDAFKRNALPVVADARVALEQLSEALAGYRVEQSYTAEIARLTQEWHQEVDRLFSLGNEPRPAQSEIIGAVSAAAGPRDVVVCAAGSLPGDLHKLWRPRDPKGYHLEYGYSCMGYELPGGMGIKMADPSREVFVMIGDGSYLMMPSEITTSIQEGIKLTVVLIDSGGFTSIGNLSRSVGSDGFGTRYKHRDEKTGQLTGADVRVDFVANVRSLGAIAIEANTIAELKAGLEDAKKTDRTTVVVIKSDPSVGVPGYDSWWDVPVAEVSTMPAVKAAREGYEEAVKKERVFL
jgi:3D-(3,5/4)-trihydroxycyclohexane-1,2-dione acylhydrolase (decyclizing)